MQPGYPCSTANQNKNICHCDMKPRMTASTKITYMQQRTYIIKGSLAQKLPIYEQHLSKVKSQLSKVSKVKSQLSKVTVQ